MRTSVNGFDTVWHDVLERFFTRTPLAGSWELNDFGATPGVVTLRLRQASEAAARTTSMTDTCLIAGPDLAGAARTTQLHRTRRAGPGRGLLDPGSLRVLAGPFDRLESPWLEPQGITPQADDGTVIARGTVDGHPVVIAAIEQGFQGGGTGEVSGAKISQALLLAAADSRAGTPDRRVILFETGGVRLQEANLGLNAVAEICSAVLDLRPHAPVIGVVAGTVGSFGGMSIAAGCAPG